MIIVPVWNPCFVHAGCTPENIVPCAKTKIDMKALDSLTPTSNSCEKSLTLDVTSMLSYAWQVESDSIEIRCWDIA